MSWILCAENAITFMWVAKAILYLASLLLFLHSISHLTARMSLSWSHQASKPKISSDSCHPYSDPQSLPVTEMSAVCQSPCLKIPEHLPPAPRLIPTPTSLFLIQVQNLLEISLQHGRLTLAFNFSFTCLG